MNARSGAQKHKYTQVPRQAGELARLKVIQGPDSGALFIVLARQVVLGRGEDCDVMVSDLKASRQHATLRASGGAWELEDLGSANGVSLNGSFTRKVGVRNRDVFSVGDTFFEFMDSSLEGTQMLTAPGAGIQAVVQGQRAVINHEARVAELRGAKGESLGSIASELFKPKSGAPVASGGLLKNPLVIGVLGVGVVLLFFVDDPKPTGNRKPARASKDAALVMNAKDLAEYLPPEVLAQANGLSRDGKGDSLTLQTQKSVAMFIKGGFREYRQGNYLRAKVQFENVLQIAPANNLARVYLENCNRKIDADVKRYMELGRKDLEAGKFRNAKAQFEAVLRLLFKDQSNANFVESQEHVELIQKAIADGDTSSLHAARRKPAQEPKTEETGASP